MTRCIKPLTLRDAEDRARTVPCGRCNFCLEALRTDWTIRILQEQKSSESAHFLTLTYNDDYLNYSPSGEPTLCKEDVQKFFKRLRKHNAKYTQKSIRYFAIGEYGESYERPHYHAIMFNCSAQTIAELGNIWPIGYHRIGNVQLGSIHYVTGYLINRYRDYGDRDSPFALQSRKPGLGYYYLQTAGIPEWHKPNDNEKYWRNYTKIGGFTNRLPRYYREKLFNKEEREWLNWTAAQLFDRQYEQEIQRLSKLTRKDPHEYYVEIQQHKHDKIKVKKNKAL